MSDSEETRIWRGMRRHLDELASGADVPPLHVVLGSRTSPKPFGVVAGIAGAMVVILAAGTLIAMRAPMPGATETASAPPAALATRSQLDIGELIGNAYVAVDVEKDGLPIGIVPETKLWLRFNDESKFVANAGCNGIGGDYQIEQGRLKTRDMYISAMGCEGPKGSQESWYYLFLQASPEITNAGAGFALTDHGTVINFRAE